MSNRIRYTEVNGRIYNPDSCIPLEKAWGNEKIELQALTRGTYPGKSLNNKDLAGIKSIGYWNAKTQQDWGLDWHRNEGIEICFLESGTLSFELNDKVYQLNPESLTITRPWIPHKLGNPTIGLCKLHWLIIDVNVRQPHQEWQWPDWIILKKDDLVELTNILRRNEQPVWKVGQEIKDCFVQIGKSIKNSNPKFQDSKIKILVNQILILLLELFTHEKPVLNDSLIRSERSVELFLENLKSMLGEQWSLNEMVSHCGLGTTQFSKYCYKLTNMTPMNYLTQLRINKANELLLKESGKTITEIAYECGFSSNQYFTQVFKKRYKLAPHEYRLSKSHE